MKVCKASSKEILNSKVHHKILVKPLRINIGKFRYIAIYTDDHHTFLVLETSLSAVLCNDFWVLGSWMGKDGIKMNGLADNQMQRKNRKSLYPKHDSALCCFPALCDSSICCLHFIFMVCYLIKGMSKNSKEIYSMQT